MIRRMLLILALLLALTCPALADTEGFYSYWIDSSRGGAVITGYTGNETVVTVPDTLGGYSVVGLWQFTFRDNSKITTIYLPDSLRMMFADAFYGCENLKSVYLPENLTELNHYFDNRISFIVSKDSATAKLFAYDPYLYVANGFADPEFPDLKLFYAKDAQTGALTLGLYRYIGSATRYTIPDIIATIGPNAFCENKTLRSLVVPDTVKLIHRHAFSIGYDDPSSYPHMTITLPDNVAFIYGTSNDGFMSNSEYKTILCRYDSQTALNLGVYNEQFNDPQSENYDPTCASVHSTFTDPRWPDYQLGYARGLLYLCAYTGSDTVMNIPPCVEAICEHINLRSPNCDDVRRIIIPEGVVRLDRNSLWGWFHVSSIDLPSTLRYIGKRAFCYDGMESLIIPEGVRELPEEMLYGSKIRTITIPASVTSIHETALRGRKKVSKVYCPKGSYAESWAKSHGYTTAALEDAPYAIVPPQLTYFDVGDSFDWKLHTAIMPKKPDIPYTLEISSPNERVVSVVDGELSFNAPGSIKLTVSSPELGAKAETPRINVYQPVESFSVPEFYVCKYPSSQRFPIRDVVPAEKTNPFYDCYNTKWQYDPYIIPARNRYTGPEFSPEFIGTGPGVYSIEFYSMSGVRRDMVFVYYKNISDLTFHPFEGRMTIGATVTPEISANVDGCILTGVPEAYTLESSNPAVAQVIEGGKLKLTGPGRSVITATLFNGEMVSRAITVENVRALFLPEETKRIEAQAFAGNIINLVVIPEGCTAIGARAFADCKKLTRIEIPASVTEIAEDAFAGCRSDLLIAAPAGSYAAEYAAAHGFDE